MVDDLRFTYDRKQITGVSKSNTGIEGLLDHLLFQSVRVRDETFPRLATILNAVTYRVRGNLEKTELFVRPDPVLQACCYTSAARSAVIMLTSSLVERLNDDELASVIGHELGHWIYGHNGLGNIEECEQGVAQLKMLAAARCAEISADRISLVASRNVKSSLSALIKVSTGLDENNLRMDIQSFLKQYKELIERGPSPSEAMSTHPFFLLRIRAMVLFSRSQDYYKVIGTSEKKGISCEETDESIHRDLRKISGLSIEDVDDELVTEILILACFVVFAEDGTFSKDEQAFFNDTFGKLDLSSYLELVQKLGPRGLNLRLRQRITALGGVSSKNSERMKTFFSVLTQTFPSDHTAPLRSTLNSMGFV